MPHLLAALLLALFVALLFAPLLFTNRVLASGDILLYFYPYRDYAAEAFREGRTPLWNPYSFSGVPFLANPQAAVLYPLHWPLSWLPVTKQIYWSAAIHAWILGYGGYWLMRRWSLGLIAALATAIMLAGSGFYGGLIGHINQMNGAAWLPWMILALGDGGQARWGAGERGSGGAGERGSGRVFTRVAILALLIALTLLAGHTQTAFINLFGLAVWCAWILFVALADRWSMIRERWPSRFLHPISPAPLLPISTLLLAFPLAGLLAAAQLLPTLELSDLGLRSGGLSYGEASSFSLRPLLLPWTLLPSYGLADLGIVFETLGYTEFVAYVGLVALGLAVFGAWPRTDGLSRARAFGLLFAATGLFLAAGRWNPAYYVLYRLVPGFDLFRAPARWMMLYTMGVAVLAGVGARNLQLVIGNWRLRRLRNYQLLITSLVVIFLALDLLLASAALPHRHPTAPEAVYGVRTAPAHLLTDPARDALHPAAMGRFLSMSTTAFDPGDMADFRRVLVDDVARSSRALDDKEFTELVLALKAQEILAPNLPLRWRVPAVDGFDGGVLPLRRYIDLLPLFVPPNDNTGEVVPDGRLREQVRDVPPAALLNLFNVQYLITDKLRDLWFNGVYYDRQLGARLSVDAPTLTIDVPQAFEATHVDLIGYVDQPAADLPSENVEIAELTITAADEITTRPLVTGSQPGAHFADPVLDSANVSAAATRNSRMPDEGLTVAYRDVEGGRQEYLARFELPQPTMPSQIGLQRFDALGWEDAAVVIQAATLYDARTQTFAPLLPSDQGRFARVHSGDVKIYENLDVLPRAYLVHEVEAVDSREEAVARLAERLAAGTLRPSEQAVVEGELSFASTASSDDRAAIVDYAPERVEVRVSTAERTLLVLSDSLYPGWTATLDGAPTPILATNGLARGVVVPPGEHDVVFRYEPSSWRRGLWLSGVGGVLWLGVFGVGWGRGKRLRRYPVEDGDLTERGEGYRGAGEARVTLMSTLSFHRRIRARSNQRPALLNAQLVVDIQNKDGHTPLW